MRGLDAGLTYEQIGQRIGRDKSVVWREVERNKNPDGDYHALMAHARATEKAAPTKGIQALQQSVVQGHRRLDG
jgi:IS30 family transposase